MFYIQVHQKSLVRLQRNCDEAALTLSVLDSAVLLTVFHDQMASQPLYSLNLLAITMARFSQAPDGVDLGADYFDFLEDLQTQAGHFNMLAAEIRQGLCAIDLG